MPAPEGSDRYSGQARFRETVRGKLVLEVEVNVTSYSQEERGYSPHWLWRDATSHDLYPLKYVRKHKELGSLI